MNNKRTTKGLLTDLTVVPHAYNRTDAWTKSDTLLKPGWFHKYRRKKKQGKKYQSETIICVLFTMLETVTILHWWTEYCPRVNMLTFSVTKIINYNFQIQWWNNFTIRKIKGSSKPNQITSQPSFYIENASKQ